MNLGAVLGLALGFGLACWVALLVGAFVFASRDLAWEVRLGIAFLGFWLALVPVKLVARYVGDWLHINVQRLEAEGLLGRVRAAWAAEKEGVGREGKGAMMGNWRRALEECGQQQSEAKAIGKS